MYCLLCSKILAALGKKRVSKADTFKLAGILVHKYYGDFRACLPAGELRRSFRPYFPSVYQERGSREDDGN